jgi:hypothetical protein
MKTSVWKYRITRSGANTFEMPQGAKFVRFAMQAGDPTLWAHVDPDAPFRNRQVQVFGTGHPIPDGAKYIDSCDDGPFVWHAFELV